MSVPYHRLPRVDARWRWWRPLVALAFLAGWYLASQVLITVAYFVPVAAVGGESGLYDLLDDLQRGALDPTDPLILSLTLVSLVILLPGILLAVKVARLGPGAILTSTRFRVRWAWTAWCVLPTLVIAAIMFVVQTGLFWDGGMITTDGGFAWNHAAIGQSTVSLGTLTLTIVLVVLLVPFQGAAEEFIFRGFLMQTIASWIPRRTGTLIAVAVSTVVFAVLHIPNGYNVWGILDVGSFGLIAAIIVLRTGGLEATVLQHAFNNIMIFVLQAPGWSGIDLASSDANGTLGGWLVTLGTSLLFWGMVELLAWWRKLDRTFAGHQAPRFRGTPPVWAGGKRWLGPAGTGWAAAPARADDVDAAAVDRAAVDSAVGVAGRP
ncbi:CAAX prenyl protease-like protein [Curtobacterium sp. PhB172]|uniref:CPBP family intramembrane glutamic endopeptidase n=1 Tax=unclassified Curtobacterium TaxID=257496 RepID=UPI000F49C7C8|nr:MULTISPECIES: CPBP family intramembrane glutamic endopeptidase [unclassified Curtobacterium]ROQ17560.1 CAAX prenyl protease-like protein [Curtobacterium sp. PhB171]ROQ29195.1 CAAX prenyl protease-like protein [Curtobacterium sp. PhB170]ROS45661.1 CAAX prenyl protease-like protein [Curtobacterium sp. PhB131]ROS65204.1 CAAX prenyl protease-like protein [Curtobacterium sp. PhB172]ROS68037.1 CAAX prenyl protease-like protein [Curtobacterium sp. PhB141]